MTMPATNAVPAPAAPQVWCVDILPDDDYESFPQLDQVFTTEDAANTYAAQVRKPRDARVYPMPLLDAAPRLFTNYRHVVSLPARREAGLFSNHHVGYRFDPTTATPDMNQFVQIEMSGRDTLEPVTVTVHPEANNGLVLIEVVGTDRDAVDAAFVKAYLDVERTSGERA